MDGWMDGQWKTGRSEEGWLLDIFPDRDSWRRLLMGNFRLDGLEG